ncbi:CLOCK-interacting pacemaker [Nelusetta ayraudi]|uniref:CLOCK-interacting pacemaker n=1 Tax=Nelusetta ayraudi TaxID=303726 RepID=UPI003F6F82EA
MSSKRKAEIHSRGTNRPRTMKSGGSQVDSERDSGFSDASSEHMSTMDTTDSEDSPRRQVQQGAQASQLAVVGGSYPNLSSMIIMNNVLLKQSGDNPPALKPWGFSPAVEMVQPVVQQPQVVFLQPVVSRRASKEASSRHRRTKNYLPILKSYPKIAPHPGDSSGSSGRGTASSSSSCSSSSSSSMSSISSSGSERGASSQRELSLKEKRHRSKSGGAVNLSSAPPSVPATPSAASPPLQSRLSARPEEGSAGSSPASERPLSAGSQPELPVSHGSAFKSETVGVPAPVTPESVGLQSPEPPEPGDSDSDAKRKRFCNTYNILSKSGLLDIALRTKELHRMNRRTQTDLERLREHTDLFLQALLNGDNNVCLKLQAHLKQEEGKEKDEERAAGQAGLKAD